MLKHPTFFSEVISLNHHKVLGFDSCSKITLSQSLEGCRSYQLPTSNFRLFNLTLVKAPILL
jgi:hypothetical protein